MSIKKIMLPFIFFLVVFHGGNAFAANTPKCSDSGNVLDQANALLGHAGITSQQVEFFRGMLIACTKKFSTLSGDDKMAFSGQIVKLIATSEKTIKGLTEGEDDRGKRLTNVKSALITAERAIKIILAEPGCAETEIFYQATNALLVDLNISETELDKFKLALDACLQNGISSEAQVTAFLSKLEGFILKTKTTIATLVPMDNTEKRIGYLESIKFKLAASRALAKQKTKKSSCDKGTYQLRTDASKLISKREVAASDVETFKAELFECAEKARSFSKEDKKEFLNDLKELVSQTNASIAEAALVEENKEKRALLILVRKALKTAPIIIGNKSPIDKGWDNAFTTSFYLGFEGASVKGVKEEETARAGMMVYNQMLGPLKADDWGIHFFGNVLLTSSAELSPEDEQNDVSVKQAFELDANLYIPFSFSEEQSDKDGIKKLLAVGPIGTAAIKKVDDIALFTRKYMGGLRFAHSPESFLDVLWGKTEGVEGKRVEVRGQLPVGEMLDGSVFVGGILNLSDGLNSQDKDSLRAYVTWHIDFSDFLTKEE